jgi:SPP1 family predicted phage head-tail adaptor
MKAGDLRRRIEIQTNTPVANGIGELVDTWTTQATVWAEIEPLTGSRYFQAKQANADVTGIIRIRYRDGMLPTMRLLYGTRVLQIVSIMVPKECKRTLQIMYKEALD